MSGISEVYPIWIVDEKQVIASNKKKCKEITQTIKIKINGLRKSETEVLKSPELHLNHLNNSFWYLTLEPKVKQNDSDYNYLGLFLHLKGRDCERLSGQIAKFKISFINTKSGKILTKTSKCLYFSCNSGWGWKYFIRRDNIFENSKRSLDLNLFVSITLIQMKDFDSDSQELCSGDYQRCDNFAFNHDLMNDREYCDIKFCVEEMDFVVHSKLLATKSSVFKSMFAKEKEISIRELDAIVFYELISFIYKGYSPNIEKHCKQLMIASNYYRISQLKSICDNLCYRNLCPEEAIEALLFATKYRTFSTRIRTLCYIAINLERVINSSQEKWKQFKSKNRLLFEEIIEIKKMKCECVRH